MWAPPASRRRSVPRPEAHEYSLILAAGIDVQVLFERLGHHGANKTGDALRAHLRDAVADGRPAQVPEAEVENQMPVCPWP